MSGPDRIDMSGARWSGPAVTDAAKDAASLRSSGESATSSAATRQRERAEFILKYGIAPEEVTPSRTIPGDITKTGEEYLQTLDPPLAKQVKMLAEGRRAFPTGAALRNPSTMQLIAAATQYDPQLDAANAATRVATRKDFTSGMSARNLTALNTAVGHLATLRKLSTELNNSSFPKVNAFVNYLQSEQLGDPRVRKYKTAAMAFAGELAKVFKGTGAPSLTELKDWEAQLDENMSPEQFKGFVETAADLLGSRINAVGDTYNRGLSTSADPITLLSPHAQELYTALGAPTSAEPEKERPAGAGAETTAVEVPKEFQAALIDYVNAKGKDINPKEYQAFFNNAAKTYGFPGRVSEEEANRNVEALRGGARFGGAQPAERPLTPVERGVNETLMSTPGAAGVGIVNATTLGLPAMLSEDAGRTIEGVREASPMSYGAGDILGSAAMTALGGAGLRAVGMSAPKAEGLADLIYSATTGATGAPEGERLSGAATNAAFAGAGSMAPSVVQRVLKPNPDEDIKLLRDAGVRLTPMQTVGGRADQVEEAASRMLIGGGDVAIAARKRAFNDFNTAYLNQAGKYINFQLPNDLKPQQRMKAMGEAFDKQYETIRAQMGVFPDQELLTDIANLKTLIDDGVTFSAENATRLKKLLEDQLERRTANPIDGDEYKSLSSLLKKRRNAFAKAGNQELADGVADMQAVLDNAARRISPPEVVDMLNKTDRGFAMFAGAQEAGRMAGGMPGEFTPAQILSRQRASDTRARSRSYIEGDIEGQRLAEAGRTVLGNALPSSGTSERLASGLFVTGSGAFLSPATLAPNVAIGLMNAPGVRDVLPKLFAGQRPKPIEGLGTWMEKAETPLRFLGSATGQQFNPVEQTPEDYATTVAEPLAELRAKYDPETDTFILPNGSRVRSDGTPVTEPIGMYRGGLMELARKYR